MQVYDFRFFVSFSIVQVQEKVCVLGFKFFFVILLGFFIFFLGILKVFFQMKIVQSFVVDKDGKSVIYFVLFIGVVGGKILLMIIVIKSLLVGNVGGQQVDIIGVMKNFINVYILLDVFIIIINVVYIFNILIIVIQSIVSVMLEKVQGFMLF